MDADLPGPDALLGEDGWDVDQSRCRSGAGLGIGVKLGIER